MHSCTVCKTSQPKVVNNKFVPLTEKGISIEKFTLNTSREVNLIFSYKTPYYNRATLQFKRGILQYKKTTIVYGQA